MRTLLLFLSVLVIQQTANCCSWDYWSFCRTVENFESRYNNTTIVTGVVVSADDDGVDFEIIDVLAGVETRSTVRIWDGTDFDCNGLHSMAVSDFLRVGDRIVINMPLIDQIENPWDVIGDYRMPMPWGLNPILRIVDGMVTGLIVGYYNQDSALWEMGYDYFVDELLNSGICELDFPNVNVSFFYDKDLDGIRDYNENFLPIGAIETSNLGDFQNFKRTGIFLYAPLGPMTITYDPSYNSDWTTSTESFFELEVDSIFTPNVRIGLTPTAEYSRMVYNLTHERFRCGEDISFEFSITNEGTVPQSGTFWVQIDSRIEKIVFEEDPAYIDLDNGVFGWDYEELDAYETLRIPAQVTAPLIEDPDEVGEIYVFKMGEEFDSSREPLACHEVELRCAFDPNDKQVFPLREDKLALISAPLKYTIRFQNTGNDYARNVVVTDTLDERLDLSTFKLLSTSHPRNLTISSNEGYDKKFDFNNIFLADSISDEPNSHGYITFSISVKPDMPVETEIDNTASIYFDFNPAIVTNTVQSIMVDSFPTNSLVNIENMDVSFYPNPAMDELVFSEEVEEVFLYDLSGRLVKRAGPTSLLKITDVDEGMYMMVLRKAKQRVTRRVVVMR